MLCIADVTVRSKEEEKKGEKSTKTCSLNLHPVHQVLVCKKAKKKKKKKNGDALHLPCVTPHPLPAQHDSFISAEEEAVYELIGARHLSTQLNRSLCTSNQDLTNGQMSLCCQVSDMHT